MEAGLTAVVGFVVLSVRIAIVPLVVIGADVLGAATLMETIPFSALLEFRIRGAFAPNVMTASENFVVS